MKNLKSSYATIPLKNPIVAASSGQTNSTANIKKLVEAGAGAVILKSIFEEQIQGLVDSMSRQEDYPEALDYIQTYVQSQEIGNYLDLLSTAKKENDVPIIASLNCYHKGEWMSFARRLEEAGADAIELNIMRIEDDILADPSIVTNEYLSIIEEVSKSVDVPIQVKIARNFLCPISTIDKMLYSGAKGITLFNRSYQMDIDIEKESVTSGKVLTKPEDVSETLRYTGLVSAKIPKIEISSSTGIHGADNAIKAILAGAHNVQMCSAIYLHGPKVITETLSAVEAWMEKKQYVSIEEFRGRLKADSVDASAYNRMQFMKYFSNYQ